MSVLKTDEEDLYIERVYPLVLQKLKELNPDEIREVKGVFKTDKTIEVVFNRKVVSDIIYMQGGKRKQGATYHFDYKFTFIFDLEWEDIIFKLDSGSSSEPDFGIGLPAITGDKILTIENTMSRIDATKNPDSNYTQELDAKILADVLEEIKTSSKKHIMFRNKDRASPTLSVMDRIRRSHGQNIG
tara:strand:+ start:267 stop:824 length:558 start_codon:yes stop_codon:yes gene_type:complete